MHTKYDESIHEQGLFYLINQMEKIILRFL